ncbi:HlyD family secretion protein [Longimicrobium terrae]|uniref:Membrane fusion protein (Multidrug efflux system) n=1 Tax=Longimicrobium terrae TaxID=1639882 RepID=A0A841GW80_9BACT|nr:HlyD family secretion protein [Longimicrobium terrae]MBB4634684.1 membrane fusion protein (multidrug efflux system) [Longimicrobium terrae]MBB6068426.1 membrane fusion protein (multidrug efflux system) [Longimicrobium terrae]NNC32707.1 HlyD family secretion protein [Longimicrobium terrae]
MAQMEETVEPRAAHAPAQPARTAPAEPAGGGMRKRIILGVVAVALVGLAIWGFRKWQWSQSHVTTDNAQVEGHITPVLARTGGYVNKVMVQDNQHVKAGDVLVVLDDRDLQARLAQANAELNALLAVSGGEGHVGQAAAQIGGAEASASASQAQVAQAQAQVRQAQAAARKATSDLERMRTLAARNIVSQQQLDAANAASEAANSAVSAAQAQVTAAQRNASAASQQVTVAQAGLQGADARVAAARAARDGVALQLSYTRVVAPADGVVSKRTVEAGQLVQPGQPLMTVVPLTDVWVVANFKETEVRTVVPGEDVEFEVDAYPGHAFHGEVESLSPATGAKFSLLPPDNSTGNYTKVVQRIPVKVRVTGGMDAAHPLRPGMSAEVVVDIPST